MVDKCNCGCEKHYFSNQELLRKVGFKVLLKAVVEKVDCGFSPDDKRVKKIRNDIVSYLKK